VPDHLLSIGELADRVGLRPSALRYYEQRGLLEPVARVGGQRRYAEDATDTVTVIQFCRQLDFSLDEIAELLREPRGSAQRRRWRELVDAKVEELDAAGRRIRAMKRVLGISRDCDCVDLETCAAICSSAA
jgi:MerR family redox-sensitive transcriptional activator SoxR